MLRLEVSGPCSAGTQTIRGFIDKCQTTALVALHRQSNGVERTVRPWQVPGADRRISIARDGPSVKSRKRRKQGLGLCHLPL